MVDDGGPVIRQADGTLVCWGDNTYDQAVVLAGLGAVSAVSAGGYHTCAFRQAARTLVCWGNNDYGQTNVPVDPVARSLPAVVRSGTTWLLRGSLTGGSATLTFGYGAKPLVPIMGDWDGDGTRTAGTYEAGVFKLNNQNDSSAADITFTFGDPRGFPVVGDYNGDGTEDVAVYRNGLWQLRLSNGATSQFTFGAGSWPFTVPVAGDWDGDGSDAIGTYTYTSATWALRNSATSGPADAGTFVFGTANSYPVPGDWNADSIDTVGVKTGVIWTLRNTNTSGPPDVTFDFGLANDLPLTWRTPTTTP